MDRWRKTSLFTLVVILALVIFCYLHTRLSDAGARLAMQPSRLVDIDVNGPLRNVILIYARVRTGSTFTSEFFNRHSKIFYIFEPLQFMPFSTVLYNGSKILEEFVRCRFKDVLKGHSGDWAQQRFCHISNPKYCPKVHITQMENLCMASVIVAAKIILFQRLEYLDTLVAQGARVVVLWRDPRGVLNSRRVTSRSRFPSEKGFEYDEAGWYCFSMLQDLAYLRRQRGERALSYHIVRYEDLAMDPVGSIADLYDFVGLEPDKALYDWAADVVKGHPNVKETPLGTTRRNSTVSAQSWRSSMPFPIVTQVQEACRDFMSTAGYISVRSQKEQDDLDNILVKQMKLRQFIGG